MAFKQIPFAIRSAGFNDRNEFENELWIYAAASVVKDCFLKMNKKIRPLDLLVRKGHPLSFEKEMVEVKDGVEVRELKNISGKADICMINYANDGSVRPLLVVEVKAGLAETALTQCILALKAVKTDRPNEKVVLASIFLRIEK